MGHHLIACLESFFDDIAVPDRHTERYLTREGLTVPHDTDNTVRAAMNNGVFMDSDDLLDFADGHQDGHTLVYSETR